MALMKYWGLRLLRWICYAAIVGLPYAIGQLFKANELVPAAALGLVQVSVLYSQNVIANTIAKGDFVKWSAVVKRIYGALEVGYRVAGFAPKEDVRITLYVPHKRRADCLVQIVPYFPTGKYMASSRRMSIHKGIVGKCFRTRKAQMQTLKSSDSYRKELVSKWGYTVDEAGRISTDKGALAALPVFRPDGVVGAVVFLDAKSRNAFKPPSRVKMIKKVCVVIGKWA